MVDFVFMFTGGYYVINIIGFIIEYQRKNERKGVDNMSWRVKMNIEVTKEIGWKLTLVWWAMGIVCYLLWVMQIYAFMNPEDLADWLFTLLFPLFFGIFIFYVYVICIFALFERIGKLTKEEKDDDSMTLPEIP